MLISMSCQIRACSFCLSASWVQALFPLNLCIVFIPSLLHYPYIYAFIVIWFTIIILSQYLQTFSLSLLSPSELWLPNSCDVMSLRQRTSTLILHSASLMSSARAPLPGPQDRTSLDSKLKQPRGTSLAPHISGASVLHCTLKIYISYFSCCCCFFQVQG